MGLGGSGGGGRIFVDSNGGVGGRFDGFRGTGAR